MTKWRPKEIIVRDQVKDDPVTSYFIENCHGVPVRDVNTANPKAVLNASKILSSAYTMLEKILAGKQVVFIAPAADVVDIFTMPDNRIACPSFDRLKLASNGCFYQCDWCYLKITYRAAFPFITIRAQYDRIKSQLQKRLKQFKASLIFSTGELADSLAMEHLTGGAQEFIPWFGQTDNGYLFMLTKSDNVNEILDLPHNGHTIIAWSINNEIVSRKFEIEAPLFEARLEAAYKVQNAGYPLRLRIDPVVPISGWKTAYSDTIRKIFEKVSPERVTIGTLRFAEQFYKCRKNLFTTGNELMQFVENMEPMFSPKLFPGSKRAKSGKYSFNLEKRVEIFSFIIRQIRKYSNCDIALCKESREVWKMVGLDLSRCSCACQLYSTNIA